MEIANLSTKEFKEVLSRLDCYLFVKDVDRRYVYANEAVAQLFGRSADDIIGCDDAQFFDLDACNELLVHDKQVLNGESISKVERNVDNDGFIRHYQTLKTPIYDNQGRVKGIFGLSIDISESIAKRDQLEYLALRDALTGVFNRRYLDMQLKREVASHVRRSKPLSFVMIDVDNFKGVNDRFGHSVGDQVLQRIGQLLMSSVREEDYCFRFGGDEFALLLPMTSALSAYQVAERVRSRVVGINFLPTRERRSVSMLALVWRS
ncbi:sensor domain-containing diguanylate cyclase [Vibrio variabilis]|uniref:sensor domain-containing diguanylate cyclase n=1 Tax=Vibrio variabilis TaxID=990271 RepID=UPI0013A6DA94|nr:GGDEF domain-containing protein [Vibrio variabilis]